MLVVIMLIHCVTLRQPSEYCLHVVITGANIYIPMYTHHTHSTIHTLCYCDFVTYYYRNEVMECLLVRSNELPTACRVIIRNEQHEQVV